MLYKNAFWFKHLMNLYPPFWATGIALSEVSPDFKRSVVQMRHRFYNTNAFRTHFGGSLYAMCDPFYALMLVKLLGKGYTVWDKAASIDFVQPGVGTVQAVFDWSDAQLDQIRQQAESGEKVLPERVVHITDEKNQIVATVHKTLYVRKKRTA